MEESVKEWDIRTGRGKNRKIILLLTFIFFIKLVFGNLFPADTPEILIQPITETFLRIVFNGPLLEELCYRGVLIGVISQFVLWLVPPFRNLNLTSRANNFPIIGGSNTRVMFVFRFFETVLLLFSSFWFSYDHLSMWGEQTFYYYFASGVIFGTLFLRYGISSSVMWHCYGNFMSLILFKLQIKDIVTNLALLVSFCGFLILLEYKPEILANFLEFFRRRPLMLGCLWLVSFGIILILYSLLGGIIFDFPPVISLALYWLVGVFMLVNSGIRQFIHEYKMKKVLFNDD